MIKKRVEQEKRDSKTDNNVDDDDANNKCYRKLPKIFSKYVRHDNIDSVLARIDDTFNVGLFEKNILRENKRILLFALRDVPNASMKLFIKALVEKLTDIYTRAADIEAGDNLCLAAVHHYSRENLQNQLNMHHFNAERREIVSTTTGSEVTFECPRAKLESIVNLSASKDIWQQRAAVMIVYDDEDYGVESKNNKNITHQKKTFSTTFCNPEILTEIIVGDRHGKTHWFATKDIKNISKSLEGLLLLQGLFSVEGMHSPRSGKSTLMIALNMATVSGKSARRESLSSLTRNGISAILPPQTTLAEILYEDCSNKLERRIRANNGIAVDNLEHPLSRLLCGMPTKLGMTSFDVIVKNTN